MRSFYSFNGNFLSLALLTACGFAAAMFLLLENSRALITLVCSRAALIDGFTLDDLT